MNLLKVNPQMFWTPYLYINSLGVRLIKSFHEVGDKLKLKEVEQVSVLRDICSYGDLNTSFILPKSKIIKRHHTISCLLIISPCNYVNWYYILQIMSSCHNYTATTIITFAFTLLKGCLHINTYRWSLSITTLNAKYSHEQVSQHVQ